MKLAIHSFVWSDAQDQNSLELVMEKAVATGYSLIEFPGVDRNKINVDRIAKRAEQLGLGVLASAGLAPEYDLTSEDPEVVRRGEAFLHEAVSVARDLGSRQMSGPMFSAHQKFKTMPTRRGWDTSVGVLRKVSEKAKAANVALCMELVNRYETNLINTVQQGLAYIRDSGSDNIYLHLDTFHMNMEEEDPAQAIRLAGDRIGYFHIGESNRGNLGSGTIQYAPIFDALLDIGYSRNIGIEAFANAGCGDWLKAICAVWRENWSDGDNFARTSKTFVEMKINEAKGRRAAYRAA
ncbi:sugar phosphate isomerase/epimerase family protein [Rhizobium sp. NPDC090275]|uniref:sugar phosphate isomerase/epimerase family protein n=1 Tax=Rhizobium sp. NPDC090275 TaxID=3364498 RepID=UPI00383A317E